MICNLWCIVHVDQPSWNFIIISFFTQLKEKNYQILMERRKRLCLHQALCIKMLQQHNVILENQTALFEDAV